jgi:hypothetical protein
MTVDTHYHSLKGGTAMVKTYRDPTPREKDATTDLLEKIDRGEWLLEPRTDIDEDDE